MAYRDPKRKCGSQAEIPAFVLSSRNGNVQYYDVSGYQHFSVPLDINAPPGSKSHDIIVPPGPYKDKFLKIQNFLMSMDNRHDKTLVDLGCSNGLVCFIAAQCNLKSVIGLDHDTECLSMLHNITKTIRTNSTDLSFNQWSFGDTIPETDILVVSALIHWVYSCTSNYGSLDAIIAYLAATVRETLIIEWIAPNDLGIQMLGHIHHNPNLHKEPYTFANFQAALDKYFVSSYKLCDVKDTRQLFVAHKSNSPSPSPNVQSISGLDGISGLDDSPWLQQFPFQTFVQYHAPYNATSKIFKSTDHTVVIKQIIPSAYQQSNIYEREMFWLIKIATSGFTWAPKLLQCSQDPKNPWFAMTYVGEPINTKNIPPDWIVQTKQIDKEMMELNCKHNDMRACEILVHHGRISIVDFGWASCGSDFTCNMDISGDAKPWGLHNNSVESVVKYCLLV